MNKFEQMFIAANRWILIFLLAAMSVIVFANVVMRYVTDASIPWSEEVSRHMMIWLTFIGGGLVLRSGGHIAIDNLQDALSTPAARAMRGFVLALMVIFLLLLVYHGWNYVSRTMVQTTAATEIPFGYIYLAMPIGAALMLVHLALIARRWLLHREFIADEDFDATSSASL
ncbi:TRAP transporter small permease [Noviherbaspirillum sedimenti]|uniref:TRAP transporter small permease protein n=1 Tax=Noviherbaspirillum sedimenti TaxID=2320865 RepID=A0A3A3G565_9BURK|nr:TRAP transporter small permease [Noviherbaspirillum sedimenti]RJG03637.1 TRAP transporter small permease [Noviherbaspirillum sedimenti]